MECYQAYPQKEIFFDASRNKQIGNFDKLAGTTLLRKQIIAGAFRTVHIRQSWEPALSRFKNQKKKIPVVSRLVDSCKGGVNC